MDRETDDMILIILNQNIRQHYTYEKTNSQFIQMVEKLQF
jgi:hypothetical protein